MLEQRVRRRLAEWEAAGLLRVLGPPAGLDFSSNDYLNLSTHPIIVDRLARALRPEGCGGTGSRPPPGDRPLFAPAGRRVPGVQRPATPPGFFSAPLPHIRAAGPTAATGAAGRWSGVHTGHLAIAPRGRGPCSSPGGPPRRLRRRSTRA